MNINIDFTLLGDCILKEPAINAWAERNHSKPSVWVENEEYRELWSHHPRINLADQRFENPDVTFEGRSASDAFFEAISLKLPFAAGYFKQLGLTIDPSDRVRYQIFGLDINRLSKRVDPYICVCPYSRSCTSNFGQPPNIKLSDGLWSQIAGSVNLPFFSLGGKDDVPISGIIPYHGRPFREVAHFMMASSLVISVETGLLHLVGGIPGRPPVIFLSCATPEWFCAPDRAKVIRSVNPAEFKLSDVKSEISITRGFANFKIEDTIKAVRSQVGP